MALLQQKEEPAEAVSTPTYVGASSFVFQRKAKAFLDITAASILLIAFAPIMVIVSILVSLDGGPVFFGHARIGRGGRKFYCWKFRTMNPNAEAALQTLLENDPEAREIWNREFKLPNDPRVTRIGRFLRRSSIDELPQLWNVLRGDMSLIGPRPVTEPELQMYGPHRSDYLSCRPGLTGLWQVTRHKSIGYDDRVRLDCAYVENWSLWLDLSIALRTFPAIIRPGRLLRPHPQEPPSEPEKPSERLLEKS